ncbi:MAG: IS1182 family transposase [Bryobacteraceae bacterium]
MRHKTYQYLNVLVYTILMDAQQASREPEAQPVSREVRPEAGAPPQKLVFGQRPRKGRPDSAGKPKPKLKPIHRSQLMMKVVDLESWVEPNHPARAIWDLMGRMDLSGFYDKIRSRQGEKGREANSPRLLASVWVYAYSKGISSAREIERQMEHEPGLMWLCGMAKVNHHTLSDFRVNHKEELDGLFQQLLAVLDEGGFVDLSRVMHDGTKVRSYAGVDTFRREKTIRERLEEARQVVEQMGDPREDGDGGNRRQRAARERASRERAEKLEAALKTLETIQEEQKKPEAAAEARVSVTEPEARKMKHGDQAIAPSYNMQVSTESSNKVIVGMHLSTCSADAPSLPKAVEVIEENTGRLPEQLVVDGGFTSKENILMADERQIDLIGSLGDVEKKRAGAAKAAGMDAAFGVDFFIFQTETNTLECPAGKQLHYTGANTKRENRYHRYQAQGSDCQACEHQKRCCPREPERGRRVARLVEEHPQVAEFRKKMETEEAQQIYKQRGEVAEFPNAWIKDKIGLRKFRLRGLLKAETEGLWACLAYNAKQWIRLAWKPRAAVSMA